MKRTCTFFLIAILGWGGVLLAQPTITFQMTNAFLSGSGPTQRLEFDIEAVGNQAGTYPQFGIVSLIYDTTAFGELIAGNGKITAALGTQLSETNTSGSPKYAFTNPSITVDNAFNIVNIPWTANIFNAGTSFLTELPTAFEQIMHISIEIKRPNSIAGLRFNTSLSAMSGQHFYTPANFSLYTEAFGADYNTLNLSNVPQLPLEGLMLRAIPGRRNITIDWSIEREINNKGFFVQRSGDGEQFSQLGWVDGAGNARNTRYAFEDNTAGPNKTYYYRLRQVDIDGTVHFSPTIQSRIESSSSLFVDVAPNPVIGKEAVIKVTMPEEGEVIYTISDNTGRTITEGKLNTLPRGTSGHRIPVNTATGVYHIHISDGIRQASAVLLVE